MENRLASDYGLVLLVCCCFLTFTVSAQECVTKPDNAAGVCTPIKQCPYFLKMILNLGTSSTATEDRKVLQQNQCVSSDQEVIICCPKSNLLTTQSSCGAFTEPSRILIPNTTIDDFPWLALIEYTSDANEKSHLCSGALINNRYVLTAAHCVSGAALTDHWRLSGVRLGEWDIATNPDCFVSPTRTICAPVYKDIPIEKSIVHPQYSERRRDQQNDLALLRLKDPVEYNDFIRPICLPNGQTHANEWADKIMEVGGWERTATTMFKSKVRVWKLEDCRKSYAEHELRIQTSQICASAETNSGKDNCRGSSGGPLMHIINNRYYLAGISSFGPNECGMQGWPDVYTRISPFVDWIQSVITV